MKSFLNTSLAGLFLIGLAIAQQPAEELSPYPAISNPGLDSVDCNQIRLWDDITLATGDIRIVGLAHDEVNGKWFFSGSNIGVPQVYIFNDGPLGSPDLTTMRVIPQSPNMVSPYWGNRDGEWDPVGGMVYFGDEANNIHELDPVTETWTSNWFTCPGSASGTVRGLCVYTDLASNRLVAWHANWSNNLEQWAWNLPLSGSAPYAGTLIQNSFINPGSTYGITIVETANGPNSGLAVHHQVQHTCTGVGLIKISILDIATGNSIGTLSGDYTILGNSPNFDGGIAGGIQTTTVNGQRCFAIVQQTVNDGCAYIPFQGWGYQEVADCGGILAPDGAPAIGGTTGFQVAGGAVNGLEVVFIAAMPTSPLPLSPACTIEANLAGAFFFPIPTDAGGNGTTGRVIPIPNNLSFAGVQLVSDTIGFDQTLAITSTSTNTITLEAPAF